jgi:hypothetical protein
MSRAQGATNTTKKKRIPTLREQDKYTSHKAGHMNRKNEEKGKGIYRPVHYRHAIIREQLTIRMHVLKEGKGGRFTVGLKTLQ